MAGLGFGDGGGWYLGGGSGSDTTIRFGFADFGVMADFGETADFGASTELGVTADLGAPADFGTVTAVGLSTDF